MAGLSHAVLIIEAEIKSGTLITAKLAIDFNRDVATVPGSIFSKNSDGPDQLLKLGATPIHSSDDLLRLLGFEPQASTPVQRNYSPEEQKLIDLLPLNKEDLQHELELPITTFQILLSSMEIKGYIQEFMGEIRAN
jgi:DNA processing protein